MDPGVLVSHTSQALVQSYSSSLQLVTAAALATQEMLDAVARAETLLGPFTITYSTLALDGVAAQPIARTVYIDLACSATEFRCQDGPCSVRGLCGIVLLDALSAQVAPSPFLLPPDTNPPTLKLLGDQPEHARGVSESTGLPVIVTRVPVGAVYVDAGCTATDDRDGTLPVTSWGKSAVETSAPTAPDRPWPVRYSAKDSSGNTAAAAVRWVHVACADNESVCEGVNPSDARFCSREGLCIGFAVAQQVPPPVQARITLVGPATVTLRVGAAYSMCPVPRPLDAVCDQGAAAAHPEDGDISRYVAACNPLAMISDFGLSACELDLSAPGTDLIAWPW